MQTCVVSYERTRALSIAVNDLVLFVCTFPDLAKRDNTSNAGGLRTVAWYRTLGVGDVIVRCPKGDYEGTMEGPEGTGSTLNANTAAGNSGSYTYKICCVTACCLLLADCRLVTCGLWLVANLLACVACRYLRHDGQREAWGAWCDTRAS